MIELKKQRMKELILTIMTRKRFDFGAEDLLCGALLCVGLLSLVFVWALLLIITEGGAA